MTPDDTLCHLCEKEPAVKGWEVNDKPTCPGCSSWWSLRTGKWTDDAIRALAE